MTAKAASSGAPPWAVKVWADDRNVYAEMPSVNGPCIVICERSEGGLSKVLKALGAMHTADAHGEQWLRTPASPPQKLRKEGVTQADLEAARDSLRALGLVKR